MAFSVSGRLLFAGYDDFECKVRIVHSARNKSRDPLTPSPGLGCSTRRTSRHVARTRQPGQLSRRVQRRHVVMHWLLGLNGSSPYTQCGMSLADLPLAPYLGVIYMAVKSKDPRAQDNLPITEHLIEHWSAITKMTRSMPTSQFDSVHVRCASLTAVKRSHPFLQRFEFSEAGGGWIDLPNYHGTLEACVPQSNPMQHTKLYQ